MNVSTPADDEPTETNKSAPELSAAELRHKLFVPSRCLAVVAFVSFITDSIVIWNILANDFSTMMENHGFIWGIVLGTSCVIAMLGLVFVHFWIGVSSYKMLALENYDTMSLAATIACIPFVTPVVFLGLPFGLWLHLVLRKPNAKAAFAKMTVDTTANAG